MSSSRIIKESVQTDSVELEKLREKVRARMSEVEMMEKVADTRAVHALIQKIMDNITMINQDVNQIYREEKEKRRETLRFKKFFFPVGFDEMDRRAAEDARKEANAYAADRFNQTLRAGLQVSNMMAGLLDEIRNEEIVVDEKELLSGLEDVEDSLDSSSS